MFSSGSTTGGATANRRVAPFLLGREYIRNHIEIHRYFSIFFFYIYFYDFSVGLEGEEGGGHFGTADPISRLYISVTFLFSSSLL